ENLQTLVDLCHKVMVLMYHLIFRAVGFEGVYIDYSTHGWRPKRYRGRPPTEEEIAVAAYFLWKSGNEEHGHDREHWFLAKKQLEQGPAERGGGGLMFVGVVLDPCAVRNHLGG